MQLIPLAIALAALFAGPAAAAKRVTVWNCLQYDARPDSIGIACADNGNYLESLKWSVWSAKVAIASGVQEVNNCEPDCASGKFHSYPVTVKLDRVITGHFARMRIIYTGRRPPHTRKIVTIRLLTAATPR